MSESITSESLARVVIIMPVYNEARHLSRVLESIAAQTFDHERLFFVGIDGNSDDGSAQILRTWLMQSGIAGRIIVNPRRKIPISLNLGLDQTIDDDIILRFDAHTIYGPAYVAEAVYALESAPADVGCVGCAYRPERGRTFEERVVEALYTNPLGLGGADFRFGDQVREVDNVYLGAWRRGILTSCGGFNETLEANEDGEMSARIRQMGYRILRVPLPCRCLVKRGVIGSIRQWSRYGYWRAKMLQHNPRFIRLRHVLSPAAVLLVSGLALSPLRVLLPALFGVYVVLVFIGRAKEEPLAITVATCAFFPVLQFGFGVGMLSGLLTGRGKPWPPRYGSPARQSQG